MDLLKILRSVEELLYEVISWLVFYPRTLWMTLSHPLRIMQYSDGEQRDRPEKQYLETLSPPLFLVLSIALSHGIEVLAGLKMPDIREPIMAGMLSSHQNLVIFRVLMFSVHPLAFAAAWLGLSRHKLDRDSLRPPFFAQCYLAGATSILMGLASTGIRHPSMTLTVIGAITAVVTTVWFLTIQRMWFSRIAGLGKWRAFGWVLATFAASTAVVLAVALLLD